MKNNVLIIDGKEIQLSKETVENLKKQFAPKEERIVYYIGNDGGIRGLPNTSFRLGIRDKNESYNKDTLERALMFIELQNWADEHNGECTNDERVFINCHKTYKVLRAHNWETWQTGVTFFSSEEVAIEAIDHFGEDFFKKLYNIKDN